MIVASRFIQGAQVAKTERGPELAGSLKATLILGTRRFDWPTADGPPMIGDLFIVHSPGLTGEIVLLFPHCLANLASGHFERSYFL